MIEIDDMVQQELDEVAVLERQCFSMPWSKVALSEELALDFSVYLAARCDGKTVGYCGFWRVLDEGHITNIAVAPEYRRQGIASKLITEAIKRARQAELCLLTLEVRESNPAIKLYEGFGFKALGRRKRYYSDPTEDAIIMTLRLGE